MPRECEVLLSGTTASSASGGIWVRWFVVCGLLGRGDGDGRNTRWSGDIWDSDWVIKTKNLSQTCVFLWSDGEDGKVVRKVGSDYEVRVSLRCDD